MTNSIAAPQSPEPTVAGDSAVSLPVDGSAYCERVQAALSRTYAERPNGSSATDTGDVPDAAGRMERDRGGRGDAGDAGGHERAPGSRRRNGVLQHVAAGARGRIVEDVGVRAGGVEHDALWRAAGGDRGRRAEGSIAADGEVAHA